MHLWMESILVGYMLKQKSGKERSQKWAIEMDETKACYLKMLALLIEWITYQKLQYAL